MNPDHIDETGVPGLRDAARKYADIAKQYSELKRQSEGVPDAPFKSTWHELAMKRMLRYAAENGYDRVAWTTGEQQAARYDLSKQVKEVYWQPNEGILTAKLPDGGYQQIAKDVDPAKLPDYIGKEAAAKIVQPTAKDRSLSGDQDVHVLRGDDLKVGGQGMKGFYDKILPDFMNKYGKKWGAKVGETQIPGAGAAGEYQIHESPHGIWYVRDEAGDIISEHETEAGAKRSLERKSAPVHSIDITPSMKHDVIFKGQPIARNSPRTLQQIFSGANA